jgi:hypothetical protein
MEIWWVYKDEAERRRVETVRARHKWRTLLVVMSRSELDARVRAADARIDAAWQVGARAA